MKMNYKIDLKPAALLMAERGLVRGGKIQKYIDSECLRRCAPYVPFDSGELVRSGIMNTEIGSGRLVYDTPYARRWYYMPANFRGAPMRGNYWFERMKSSGGAAAITAGAQLMLKRGF